VVISTLPAWPTPQQRWPMNSECPACITQRIHTAEERAQYHPLAGHGWVDGHGWTCPEAEQAHIDDVRKWEEDKHAAK
jgi:hypothetical protein